MVSTVVSTAAMRGAAAMRLLLLVAATLAYDFNDPDAPHTSMAIRFDGEGRRADSRRAFEASSAYLGAPTCRAACSPCRSSSPRRT